MALSRSKTDCCVTECEQLVEEKLERIPTMTTTDATSTKPEFRVLRLCDTSFITSRPDSGATSLSISDRFSILRANWNYLIMVVLGFLYSFIAPAPQPLLLPPSTPPRAQHGGNQSHREDKETSTTL